MASISLPGITLPDGVTATTSTQISTVPTSTLTSSATPTSSPTTSSTPTSSSPTSTLRPTATSTSLTVVQSSVTPSVIVVTSEVVETISGSVTTSGVTSSATLSPDQDNSNSSGLSSGAKAGIIVGSVVGGCLLLLALILLCARYRKRRNNYTPGEDEIRWPAADQEADTLFPAAVRPTGGAGFIDRNPSMRTAGTSTFGSSTQHNGTYENGTTYENGYGGTYESGGTYGAGVPHPGYGAAPPSHAYSTSSYDQQYADAPPSLPGHQYANYPAATGVGYPERPLSPQDRQVGGQLSSQGHEPADYSPSEYSTGTQLDRGQSMVSRQGPLHLVNGSIAER